MTTQAGAVMTMMVTVAPEDEQEFNRWYDEEHIPELLRIPGFRSARRLRSAIEAHSYLTLYELDDASVLTSPAFLAWKEQSVSSKIMLEKMLTVTRGVYREMSFSE